MSDCLDRFEVDDTHAVGVINIHVLAAVLGNKNRSSKSERLISYILICFLQIPHYPAFALPIIHLG